MKKKFCNQKLINARGVCSIKSSLYRLFLYVFIQTLVIKLRFEVAKVTLYTSFRTCTTFIKCNNLIISKIYKTPIK